MNNKTIIFINEKTIDDVIASKILENFQYKKLGLDMSCVETINSKIFIKYLSENKFKLFNLKSELLAFLSLTLKTSVLKSYINKYDFIEEKRELTRRKFFVV